MIMYKAISYASKFNIYYFEVEDLSVVLCGALLCNNALL